MRILAFATGEIGGTAAPSLFRDYLKDLSESLWKLVFLDFNGNSH
jgi:hypothetical protein